MPARGRLCKTRDDLILSEGNEILNHHFQGEQGKGLPTKEIFLQTSSKPRHQTPSSKVRPLTAYPTTMYNRISFPLQPNASQSHKHGLSGNLGAIASDHYQEQSQPQRRSRYNAASDQCPDVNMNVRNSNQVRHFKNHKRDRSPRAAMPLEPNGKLKRKSSQELPGCVSKSGRHGGNSSANGVLSTAYTHNEEGHEQALQSMTKTYTRTFSGPPNSQQEQDIAFRTGIQSRNGKHRPTDGTRIPSEVIIIDDLDEHYPHSVLSRDISLSQRTMKREANATAFRLLQSMHKPRVGDRVIDRATSTLIYDDGEHGQHDIKFIPVVRPINQNSKIRSVGQVIPDSIGLDDNGLEHVRRSSKQQQKGLSEQNINAKTSQPRLSSRHNLTHNEPPYSNRSIHTGGFPQNISNGELCISGRRARQAHETFDQSKAKLPNGQRHGIKDYIVLDDDTNTSIGSSHFAKQASIHDTSVLSAAPNPSRGRSSFQSPATVSKQPDLRHCIARSINRKPQHSSWDDSVSAEEAFTTNTLLELGSRLRISSQTKTITAALAGPDFSVQSNDDSGDENDIGIALQAVSGRKNAARHVLNEKTSKKNYSDRRPLRTIDKPDIIVPDIDQDNIFIQDHEPTISKVNVNTEQPTSLHAQSAHQFGRQTKESMETFLRKMKAKQVGATHQKQQILEAESGYGQATAFPESGAIEPANEIISLPKPLDCSSITNPDPHDRERSRLFQDRKAEVAAGKREDQANPHNQTIERAKKLAEQDASIRAREEEIARQRADQHVKETKEQKIRERRERKAQQKSEERARKTTPTQPASNIFGMESRAPPSSAFKIATPVIESTERAPEAAISVILPTGLGASTSGESAMLAERQEIIIIDDAKDLQYGSDEEVRKELAELEALKLKVAANKERENELKAEQEAKEAKTAEKEKNLAIIRQTKETLLKASGIVRPAESMKTGAQSQPSTDQGRYLIDLRNEIDAMSKESEMDPADQLMILERRIDEKQKAQIDNHIAKLTALAGPKFEEHERHKAGNLSDIHNRIAILKAQGQMQAVHITGLSAENCDNSVPLDSAHIPEKLQQGQIDSSIRINQEANEDGSFRVDHETISSAAQLESGQSPTDISEQDKRKTNADILDQSSQTEQQPSDSLLTGSYLQDREEARKKMHFLTVDEAAKLMSASQLTGSKKRTPTFLDQARKQGRYDAARLKRDQNLLAIGASESRISRSDSLDLTPSTPSASLVERKPKPKGNRDKPVPLDKIKEHDLLLITLRETGLPWKDVLQHWVKRTGKTSREDSLRRRFHCLMKTLKPAATDPSNGEGSEERNLQKEILQVKQEQARRNIDKPPLLLGESELIPRSLNGLVGLSNAEVLAKARETLNEEERAALTPARPTYGGKCITSAAMKRYFADGHIGRYDSDETEDESDDESRTREPSPFTEEDKCHFAYYVKRKVVRSDQDEEDEVDWLMVGRTYTSLKDANAAAGAELGVMRGDVDARSICGQSWERGEDGMIRWFAKLDDGFLRVEVDRRLRTFQDGIMPESKSGWVSKRAFVALIRTMEVEYSDHAEDIGGATKRMAETQEEGDEVEVLMEIDGDDTRGAENQDGLGKEIVQGALDEDSRGDRSQRENQRVGVSMEKCSAGKNAPTDKADMALNNDDPFDDLFDDKNDDPAPEKGVERVSETVKKSRHYPNSTPAKSSNRTATTRLLTVEDVGSIYIYRDQANRAAAKRFMQAKREMAPSSQRRRIDHVLAEQAAEKAMQARLDELEMADENFSDKFETDGKVVEVYVAERLLEGPRNI